MKDMILLILGAAGSLAILAYVMKVAHQTRGSRPVRVELSQANTEISAKTVELGPYVEHMSRLFPETLGM